jgi:hypothetical protein
MLTLRILKMEKKPVNCKIFFCLACSKGFVVEEEALKCGCNPQFIVQGIFTALVPIKRSRWHRFLVWFFSKDISLMLALIGMVGLNTMLMAYLKIGVIPSLFEGIFFGLALPRLLRI